MDQKIAEKLRRSVNKVNRTEIGLSEAKGTDIPVAAVAYMKAVAAHEKLLITIVESA